MSSSSAPVQGWSRRPVNRFSKARGLSFHADHGECCELPSIMRRRPDASAPAAWRELRPPLGSRIEWRFQRPWSHASTRLSRARSPASTRSLRVPRMLRAEGLVIPCRSSARCSASAAQLRSRTSVRTPLEGPMPLAIASKSAWERSARCVDSRMSTTSCMLLASRPSLRSSLAQSLAACGAPASRGGKSTGGRMLVRTSSNLLKLPASLSSKASRQRTEVQSRASLRIASCRSPRASRKISSSVQSCWPGIAARARRAEPGVGRESGFEANGVAACCMASRRPCRPLFRTVAASTSAAILASRRNTSFSARRPASVPR